MSEPVARLALEQINIVVRDMKRSLAFYRLLGVSIQDVLAPQWSGWTPHHVNGTASNGVRVEFDSIAFAKQWNPGLDEAKLGSAVIPIFHVSSREEVDRVHARVTAAGHRSHKAPEDATGVGWSRPAFRVPVSTTESQMQFVRRISELPAAPSLGGDPCNPGPSCLRRALAAAALVCAVAAGAASAQERGPTPHGSQAGTETGGHTHGAEASEAPAALDLPPHLRAALVEEMRAVQRDTQAITAAIPLADWSAVEQAALRIRASYILERTLSADDRAALGKALPEGFVLLDQRFHEDAAHLADAARASRADTAVFYASRLLDGCTSCHTRYAGARFPGFRPAPAPHTH